MPHYHNFGWYYFFKYVLGFTGMLFLYSGLLKERTLPCFCAAETRELERRKGENNESCPTGEETDARAKRESNAQSHVPADAPREHARSPMPRKRQRQVVRNVINSKDLKSKCQVNRDLQKQRGMPTNQSSSDGNVEIRDHKRHRPGCRRALRYREGKIRNSIIHDGNSSQSSKSTACLQVDKESYDRRIFDAIMKANLQLRNSFAEQEDVELEAFACSIFSHGISPALAYVQRKISSNSSSSSSHNGHPGIIITENNENDEGSECYSSENCDSGNRFRIRRGIPFGACRKHNRESPSTSVTSIQSRSGSVYFTASSRGKRPDCKIHGRCGKNAEHPERRLRRYRVIDESDESNNETICESRMERRRTRGRRESRYRSTMIFTL